MEIAALRSAVTAVFDLGPNARRLLRLLLAEIDAPAEADRPIAPDGGVRLRPSPETIARKKRKERAKLRQDAASVADGKAGAGGWTELRQALRARIADRGLSYRQVANEIECRQGTLRTWLSQSSTAPSERAQARLRRWLREGAALPEPDAMAAPVEHDLPPPYRLTAAEQASLAGHLALGNARELRDRFGANRELLEQAAAGEHLASEVIVRVRAALDPRPGNGVAAG